MSTALISANPDMTRIKGTSTLKDLPTAGGMLSPRLIWSFLIVVTQMKISVAARPMITPANMAPVPMLPKLSTPCAMTASSAPMGVMLIVLGIITTRVAMETTAAASGFSYPLFWESM